MINGFFAQYSHFGIFETLIILCFILIVFHSITIARSLKTLIWQINLRFRKLMFVGYVRSTLMVARPLYIFIGLKLVYKFIIVLLRHFRCLHLLRGKCLHLGYKALPDFRSSYTKIRLTIKEYRVNIRILEILAFLHNICMLFVWIRKYFFKP